MSTLALSDVPRDRLHVDFFTPPPELQDYISGFNVYGTFTAQSGAIEHFFPGWATARFNFSERPWRVRLDREDERDVPLSVLFGPSSSELKLGLAADGISLGFGLTPLGQFRVLGEPASNLANRMLPLSYLWPDAGDLHRRLGQFDQCGAAFEYLADVIHDRWGKPSRHEGLIRELTALLVENHDVRVNEVCRQLRCSEAILRRIALRHFGFPLKLLLRRSRFLKSLVAIYGTGAGEWSSRIDPAYYDQSHFIRDCRDFLGTTPSEFLRRQRPMTELSMKRRMEKMGAPFLALHKSSA